MGCLAWRAEYGTVTLPDGAPGFSREDSDLTPEEARAFRAFPLLWLGPRFDGLDLRSIQFLHDGTPEGEAAARRRGPIMFTYHDRHDCRRPGLPVAQTLGGLEVYTGRVTATVQGTPYVPIVAALRRVEDGAPPAPPVAAHPRVRGVPCRDRA